MQRWPEGQHLLFQGERRGARGNKENRLGLVICPWRRPPAGCDKWRIAVEGVAMDSRDAKQIAQAAYVNAMTACSTIEAMGMVAENEFRTRNQIFPLYTKEDFDKLIEKYGIHHNA